MSLLQCEKPTRNNARSVLDCLEERYVYPVWLYGENKHAHRLRITCWEKRRVHMYFKTSTWPHLSQLLSKDRALWKTLICSSAKKVLLPVHLLWLTLSQWKKISQTVELTRPFSSRAHTFPTLCESVFARIYFLSGVDPCQFWMCIFCHVAFSWVSIRKVNHSPRFFLGREFIIAGMIPPATLREIKTLELFSSVVVVVRGQSDSSSLHAHRFRLLASEAAKKPKEAT